MTIAHPRAFNVALCLALDLDPSKVRALSLNTAVDQVPVFVVTMIATTEQAERVVDLVKFYQWMPIEEPPP